MISIRLIHVLDATSKKSYKRLVKAGAIDHMSPIMILPLITDK